MGAHRKVDDGSVNRDVTLFLCGDVMLGRGVDQILPRPGDPTLRESYLHDARGFSLLGTGFYGVIPAGPQPPVALSVTPASGANIILVLMTAAGLGVLSRSGSPSERISAASRPKRNLLVLRRFWHHWLVPAGMVTLTRTSAVAPGARATEESGAPAASVIATVQPLLESADRSNVSAALPVFRTVCV